MYPSSTPLVPDHQYHERGFAPRDLDAERDLQRVRRAQRQAVMKRPSVTSRMVRSATRFFAAVLIGVTLALAGQSYSEQLNEMITGWAPSLSWLLPAQSPKKAAEAAVSSEEAQQINSIAVDLAVVRRNMAQLAANQDQFAAKQEQMNQNIAALQQVEQDIKQQVLAPPTLKPAHPPAHNSAPSPPR